MVGKVTLENSMHQPTLSLGKALDNNIGHDVKDLDDLGISIRFQFLLHLTNWHCLFSMPKN